MLSALLLVGFFSPITPQPVGDGGSVALTLRNTTVHPETAEIQGARFAVPPHGETEAWVQCAGEPPTIEVAHHGRPQTITPAPVAFEDGPPALWITTARRGRAALEKRISAIRGDTPVKIVEPRAVPAWFGALRFSPLLMLSVSTWMELSTAQRDALRRATASGAILVLGAGEGEVPADVLEGLTRARLLGLEKAGPAMLDALGRASTRRRLETETPRIVADGQPLLSAEPYGLGEIRLIGARLTDVDPGPVGAAVFGGGGERLGAILDWVGAQRGMTEAVRSPFAPWIWYALLGLLGLALLGRFVPRVAAAGAVVWVVGAAALPPSVAEISMDAARAIALPVTADEDLIVGTFDVTLGRGGHHLLTAGLHSSLDETTPGGACRLADRRAAWWVVAGEPNARRRLTVFGFGKASLGAAVETDAPAAGAMRAVDAPLLAALAPGEVPAEVRYHFTPTPPASAAPLVLEAPPEE